MTDREKLYELIDNFDAMSVPIENFRHHFADYLIDNGVIVNQWISVTERLPEDLPENNGKKKIPCIVAYRPGRNKKPVSQFRERRYWDDEHGWYWPKMGACNITHWMPMPKAPAKDVDINA